MTKIANYARISGQTRNIRIDLLTQEKKPDHPQDSDSVINIFCDDSGLFDIVLTTSSRGHYEDVGIHDMAPEVGEQLRDFFDYAFPKGPRTTCGR